MVISDSIHTIHIFSSAQIFPVALYINNNHVHDCHQIIRDFNLAEFFSRTWNIL